MNTPVTKEVIEKIADYMKRKRYVPLVDKCKKLGISPKYYYAMCEKFGVDGKLGTRVPRVTGSKLLKTLSELDSDSDLESDSKN